MYEVFRVRGKKKDYNNSVVVFTRTRRICYTADGVKIAQWRIKSALVGAGLAVTTMILLLFFFLFDFRCRLIGSTSPNRARRHVQNIIFVFFFFFGTRNRLAMTFVVRSCDSRLYCRGRLAEIRSDRASWKSVLLFCTNNRWRLCIESYSMTWICTFGSNLVILHSLSSFHVPSPYLSAFFSFFEITQKLDFRYPVSYESICPSEA